MQELAACREQLTTLQAELEGTQREVQAATRALAEGRDEQQRRVHESEREHQQVLEGLQLALNEAKDKLQQQASQAACDRQELMVHHERLHDDARALHRTAVEELEEAKKACGALRSEALAARQQADSLRSRLQTAESAVDALEKEHQAVVDRATQWCSRKDDEIEVRAPAGCCRRVRSAWAFVGCLSRARAWLV